MDLSPITPSLFVGAQPAPQAATELAALGVKLIISMRAESRPPEVFTQPPFTALWLKTHDIIFLPIPIPTLMTGVQAALPVIQNGGRVLAHCAHGVHRGPALGAAILIGLGATAEDAMRLIREKRPAADPRAWHIQRQIRKFELAWQRQQSVP